MKNLTLFALLLISTNVQAEVEPISHPSPNTGTITPTEITAVTGSFSGSVTASSVTVLGTSGAPSISGESGYLKLRGSSTAREVHGTYVGTPYGTWQQSTDGGSSTFPHIINPLGGSVGIGTASPATTLDVNGNAQFGSGATKSTFTATGFWEPISKTKAEIDILVPTKVGQVIDCSDCTLPGLCRSTGTLAAQWRKMESATLGCGTNN